MLFSPQQQITAPTNNWDTTTVDYKGVELTAPSTPNEHTKSSTVALTTTATVYPSYGFSLNLSEGNVNATDTSTLIDIYIGASTADTIIVNNVLATGATGIDVYFPVYIPSGMKFWGAIQSALADHDMRVGITLYEGIDLAWPIYTGVETMGAVTASSSGTDLTAGSSDAYGNWTDIPAATTTTKDWKAFVVMCGADTDAAWANTVNRVRIGAGDESFGVYSGGTASNERAAGLAIREPTRIAIPSGTQIRGSMASQSNGKVTNHIVYGLY